MKDFFRECNSYTGRWNRQKFWLYPLGMSLLILLPLGLLLIGAMALEITALTYIMFGIIAIAYIYVIYVSICAYIKRFHDMNRSGWYSILGIIPYVSIIAVIWAGFFKGTSGPNQFGADPLGGTADPVVPADKISSKNTTREL